MKRIFALFIFCAILPLAAFSAPMKLAAVRPAFGIVFAFNLDPDSNTDQHLLTSSIGCGFDIPFKENSPWSIEPALDFYWSQYNLAAHGRPLPANPNNYDAVVIGFLLDVPFFYTFQLGTSVRLGLGIGTVLHMRGAFSSDPDTQRVDDMNSYFWSAAKFIMPSTGLRIEFKVSKNGDFSLGFRALWPLFNLWSGEGLPFFDNAILNGSAGLRYRLH